MSNLEDISLLRTDLLREELKQDPKKVQIVVESQYNAIVSNTMEFDKSKTPGASKNIYEVMELIQQAIQDFEKRAKVVADAKVEVSYDYPDKDLELESITFSVERRERGSFSQGGPFEGTVKNLKPILREEGPDPDHPSYRRAILGYWHDNILRMTCWARTNKAVNKRALWLEDLMEEYMWWFRYSGVNRIFYMKQSGEIIRDIGNNRIYGRQLDYFVRTERLRAVSQKELELILIRISKTGADSVGPVST